MMCELKEEEEKQDQGKDGQSFINRPEYIYRGGEGEGEGEGKGKCIENVHVRWKALKNMSNAHTRPPKVSCVTKQW